MRFKAVGWLSSCHDQSSFIYLFIFYFCFQYIGIGQLTAWVTFLLLCYIASTFSSIRGGKLIDTTKKREGKSQSEGSSERDRLLKSVGVLAVAGPLRCCRHAWEHLKARPMFEWTWYRGSCKLSTLLYMASSSD